MRKALAFTEVYARGGGNRFMTDFLNGIASSYGHLDIAANAGGLYPEDIRRLQSPATVMSVRFVTRALLGRYFRSWSPAARKAVALPLLFTEPFFFLFNVLCFCRLLRRLKPSCVLSFNGGYPAGAACLAMVVASRFSRIPVILSIVSVATRRKPVMWVYEMVIDRVVWWAADMVVVNARAVADSLNALRQAPWDKLEVIYNGVEDISFPVAQADKKDFLVVGCVARMDAAKGVLSLLDAFAEIAAERADLQLVLAGHGDASEELARRVKMFGLQGRVLLLGHFEGDVDALIRTFDFYVFPSLWEGFPYSIVEAMRAGAVIVATRVGGIPEAIDEGVEGLLVSPGSKDELVGALRRLMNDPWLCSHLSRNARLRYEASLSLQRMHDRVHAVLESHRF